MRRMAIAGLLVVASLAVGVYRAKLGAQETEARIGELRENIARAEEDITVLRAEEAYLSRPERIGPLARERLGLEPASPGQFSAVEALVGRLSGASAGVEAGDAQGGPQ